MKNVSLVLVSVLSLGALGACGGDDGGSGGGGSIPASTKLTDLTPAQGKQVCLDITALFPSHPVSCDGATIPVGLDASDCNDATPVGNITSACTATVGDARNCFGDFADLSDQDYCNGTVRTPTSCAPLMTPECDTNNNGSGSATDDPAHVLERATAILTRS
ncbi:MAG TPA: hypothetical protein VGM90_09740 [Kofleriaceae bacterium]|jgi:hypothetical protein